MGKELGKQWKTKKRPFAVAFSRDKGNWLLMPRSRTYNLSSDTTRYKLHGADPRPAKHESAGEGIRVHYEKLSNVSHLQVVNC